MARTNSILIVGVGNLLLTDDGIGVHAIHILQNEPIPGVEMIEIGTAILHGLSYVENADRVLVIDAAKGGHAPGTIYLFDADEPLQMPPTSSVHAMGLREAVRLLPRGKKLPQITILGVEPETIAYGLDLTPRVHSALPEVVSLARKTVTEWLLQKPNNTSTKAEQHSALPVN